MQIKEFENENLITDEGLNNYSIIDWKDNPYDVLFEVDKLLSSFNLEIELMDSKSDDYYFKIIKKIK